MTQQHDPTFDRDAQERREATGEVPAWALAEYEAHARQHAETLRRIACDAEWLRLYQTRIACPLDSEFDRWYAARLDAGMARLEQQREAAATAGKAVQP